MSSSGEVAELAAEGFAQAYGAAPVSVGVAPARMNIIGDHTDYNHGYVLPAAIDRHAGAALALRTDMRVRVRSDRYAAAVELDQLPNSRQGIWADYVLGVAHEVAIRSGMTTGFDAFIASHVPVGSGMSSSGALEVGFAVALLNALKIEWPGLEIARLCQAAENGFVGARTGIMDQFTALRARAENAILLDCRSLEDEQVPLPDNSLAWLLADTHVHHELAASSYNRRREECDAAASALGLESLRDATENDLDRITDAVARRRARHVISEDSRVLRAAEMLRKGAARDLGALLYASHQSLRVDFEVSCAELDCLVDLAAEIPEVIGARMTGGGFGGCILLLTEATGIDDVERGLSGGYQAQFHRSPSFYRVRSVDGAMRGRT